MISQQSFEVKVNASKRVPKAVKEHSSPTFFTSLRCFPKRSLYPPCAKEIEISLGTQMQCQSTLLALLSQLCKRNAEGRVEQVSDAKNVKPRQGGRLVGIEKGYGST